MKKLQQNFTTTEQSKRLLELGLPADSADCYYDTYDIEHSNCLRPYFLDERTYTDYFKHLSCIGTNVHCPCWSVGRLIDIFEICTGELFERKRWKESSNILLNDVLEQIELAVINTIEGVEFDFSKLEEGV